MALWIGFFGGQSVMLCVGMQNASPLSGMALMYALMSAFHAGPWLKLIARRRICDRWRTFMASLPSDVTQPIPHAAASARNLS
jgi:hypothetical protein